MNCWSVAVRVDHRPRELMKIFGPKRDAVIGEWERLLTEGLHDLCCHDLCCSPNFIPMIKCREMRWAGHVARVGDRRGFVERGRGVEL